MPGISAGSCSTVAYVSVTVLAGTLCKIPASLDTILRHTICMPSILAGREGSS